MTIDIPRCPFHSRAWGCRCEKHSDHDGWCANSGDGFAPGFTPLVIASAAIDCRGESHAHTADHECEGIE